MREFRGKVAVITGAASGIGYGIAERCAEEGMKVVMVNTRTMDSARNRPLELQNEPSDEPMSPERAAIVADFRNRAQEGMSPREVANHVFQAIRSEQLYILTHPELNSAVQERMDHILQQRKPD